MGTIPNAYNNMHYQLVADQSGGDGVRHSGLVSN
jgi:hypothetical protein